ncbi:hypothetical protein GCM10010313_83040 [Streptomyces violarus]|uniref:Uncharacterized protein n=1 Tax=Streptomyces violarus TaxID=67380 RepID=A0A7W4ZZP4_9ACTN|nr:hypothetical protein [Streptomyces violarus]MBB3081770.1 hypothetical protein [Streptomyces violarus]GHD35569.1 hypothetical protein GCM10010313_83040 [Streptomyces violarus]
MLKKRTPSISHEDHTDTTPASWRGLLSVALLTGALRHIGGLLAGLAVTWWQHD